MTFAWYGHLKYKSVPLVTVIPVSWGINQPLSLTQGAGSP
jgi:uncharacterized protein (DUF486 family)